MFYVILPQIAVLVEWSVFVVTYWSGSLEIVVA